ncbi:hypothetical protein F5X99DRAFT_403298 [Biscogniauxia marginata]|nr:hypothetical protein F5X99DRAFT_403298 [Biscogniauxia marginata]
MDTSIEDYVQSFHYHALIGGLLIGGGNCLTYQTLTSVAAWDFSTGMILGCFSNDSLAYLSLNQCIELRRS